MSSVDMFSRKPRVSEAGAQHLVVDHQALDGHAVQYADQEAGLQGLGVLGVRAGTADREYLSRGYRPEALDEVVVGVRRRRRTIRRQTIHVHGFLLPERRAPRTLPSDGGEKRRLGKGCEQRQAPRLPRSP